MAGFSNLSLTASGIKALLAAQTGAKLTLSKIGLGSGSTAGSVMGLTGLIIPELMLPISEKEIDETSSQMTLVAKMNNEELTEGFYWRETGLFFEDTDGNDVLFAYSCTTDRYDYVPAYSDQRYVKHVRIANVLTDSADITIKENKDLLYVDTLTFDEFKEKVSSSLDKTKRNISDVYSAEATYKAGDYCIYKNTLYKCISEIDTAEEFNIEHWKQIAITEELKDIYSNALAIEIGTIEPKKGPVFWFNTTKKKEQEEEVILLQLGGVDENSAIQADIDDTDYSVLNATESVAEDKTYSFEII